MRISVLITALLFMALSPSLTLSHGGGLDGFGCHHNRQEGGYHCHRGELAGQSFSSKQDALNYLSGSSVETPQTTPRQCCKVCKKGRPVGTVVFQEARPAGSRRVALAEVEGGLSD